MSECVLVIGKSGSGKTASLRNFRPNEDKVFMISATAKRLSFPCKEWKRFDGKSGHIFVTTEIARAIKAMQWAAENGRDVIFVDDFQYFPVNQYMNKALEKGYDKYSKIAKDTYDLIMACTQLPDHVRVYVLGHSETNDLGEVHMKTIGKMLDNTVTLEGLVSTVLRTHVVNGKYCFATRNNGSDTVKSPMGMFDQIADASGLIDNDLKLVDTTICDFYGIETSESNESKE